MGSVLQPHVLCDKHWALTSVHFLKPPHSPGGRCSLHFTDGETEGSRPGVSLSACWSGRAGAGAVLAWSPHWARVGARLVLVNSPNIHQQKNTQFNVGCLCQGHSAAVRGSEELMRVDQPGTTTLSERSRTRRAVNRVTPLTRTVQGGIHRDRKQVRGGGAWQGGQRPRSGISRSHNL